MFNPNLRDLIGEIEAGERLRDDHLHGVNRILREYVGSAYRGNSHSSDLNSASADNPEPFAYSFISNMLPALVYELPTVIVRARRIIGHRVTQDAMQSGIRAWLTDVDFKSELQQVVMDFLVFQGILMHYIEDDTRWSQGAVRPNAKRIAFQNWGCDSLSASINSAAFQYHWYYADLDDLLADPAIRPEAAEQLKPSAQGEEVSGPGRNPFGSVEIGQLNRRRTKVYSIWLRDKNTIRIIAKDPSVEIYEERDYYGPKTGPYSVFQAYPVPGQVYPLSPLIAVSEQVADLQIHARAAARSAAGRKTLVVVDASNAGLAESIHDASDREVIGVPGFNSSQSQQLEFGGVSNQQYEYLNLLRDRLDRHAGLTETARGNVSGGTATESQIASDALNSRTEYLKSRVRDATALSLRTIGWFLFNTPGVIIPVNRRDLITGQQSEGMFFGGQFPGEESGEWDDYAIEVEPLSMQRVTEQTLQRRAMDMARFVAETAPLIVQFPYVKWQEVFHMVGESMNQDNTDSLIIWEMLGNISVPELTPASNVLGPKPNIVQRYSVPGLGFKNREAGTQPTSAVNQSRSELSKPFGDQFGGTQGPPGSASGGF